MLHISINADEKELRRMLNGELEKMSNEEARRMTSLSNKILTVIEKETDYSYQDVMRALNMVGKYYEEKSKDFLNTVKIQEVSSFGKFSG